jgi:hypothetical protein
MKKIILFFSVFGFALISCATVRMTTPAGFAHFDKEKEYHAASADGVYIRAYMPSENGLDDKTPLKTWTDDMKRVLQTKGYVLISQNEITADGGGTGEYNEYEVLYNGETWIFAFMAIKKDDVLLVAEASGEKKLYAAKREKLLAAMKTVYKK